MNKYLRRVSVSTLFGDKSKNLVIDFDEAVNCIYGINGSGKTTVINLIVACLTCDLRKLKELVFESATIYLSGASRRRAERFVSVSKDSDGDIVYDFGERELYTFEIMNEYEVYQGKNFDYLKKKVYEKIRSNLSLTYVPLTRMQEGEVYSHDYMDDFALRRALVNRDYDEESVVNITDYTRRMLSELERSFVKKYADAQEQINVELEGLKNTIVQNVMLDKKTKKEIARFRDEMSDDDVKIISHKDPAEYYKMFLSANMDIKKESLEEHFRILDESVLNFTKMHKKRKAIISDKFEIKTKEQDDVMNDFFKSWLDLTALMPIFRKFQSIIDEVVKAENNKNKHLDLFRVFERLINTFFVNKVFNFSKSGGFEVECNGRGIKVYDLSSGEKHILALLGRVALSPNEGALFIADEPELSLHLEWQRRIIPSINEISPDMQIIVATHSPAIIPEDALMIDLEECYK